MQAYLGRSNPGKSNRKLGGTSGEAETVMTCYRRLQGPLKSLHRSLLSFRFGDIPGPGNLGLGLGVHFFNPACQFCTTVSGGAAPHFSTLATRNRWPSLLTAQSRPIRRLKCTHYFFNVDCQFSITVNGGGAFCASGTATRNRFPSAVTSHTSVPKES